jgi:recombination protein RecA
MASKRTKLAADAPAGSYFARLASDKNLPFVSSGCGLLDCALGGGWVLGRVANVVGDKSAGKTLLAIEAMVNFSRAYPDGISRYAEAESAFDEEYAEAIGYDRSKVERPEPGVVDTVESFFSDVEAFLDRLDGKPGLYIVDSLDSLSSLAELKRKPGEATYGQEKAKMMSEGFRRLVRRIEAARVLLIVISQVRENIGVTFGETKTRSGGKALDFYASQILWLADMGKIKRTVQGIERVVGFNVKAQVKKNKVGLAWRTVQYPLIFGYGIDDTQAGIEWLISVTTKDTHPLLDELRVSKTSVVAYTQRLRDASSSVRAVVARQVDTAVKERWAEVEGTFLPKSRKYG